MSPHSSLINCLDNGFIQLDFSLSVCILMNWLYPYYGSLFKGFLSTCRPYKCVPMVELNQYFGQSKVSLHCKPVTLVEHMQMNSTQISLIGCSQRPSCSWGLSHHSVLCWQCVHTSLGAHSRYSICRTMKVSQWQMLLLKHVIYSENKCITFV